MSEIKDGGNEPAFPVSDVSQYQFCGLSIRDWFAAKALSGLLADADNSYCKASDDEGIELERREYAEAMASDAYRYADAMIKARNA